MGAEMEEKCKIHKGTGADLLRQNRHELQVSIQITLFELNW